MTGFSSFHGIHGISERIFRVAGPAQRLRDMEVNPEIFDELAETAMEDSCMMIK